MARLLVVLAILTSVAIQAQEVPQKLRGRWVVKRELPTSTISCWGEKEAKQLIGTDLEYTADSFRWKSTTVAHPTVKVRSVTAEQFHDENSGQGTNSSQVSFGELGIRANRVEQIELEANGATTEIPGDKVLMKSPNAIVFSVCNVYFEARRVRVSSRSRR